MEQPHHGQGKVSHSMDSCFCEWYISCATRSLFVQGQRLTGAANRMKQATFVMGNFEEMGNIEA